MDGESPIYAPRPIKRQRGTADDVRLRRALLGAIVSQNKPVTVRQAYYLATVRGIVEKTEAGYGKVKTDLALLRRAGVIPYASLADSTRWQRKPKTFDGVEEALNNVAEFYRKSLWRGANAYVEVWIEKDALTGVVLPVTSKYDVPLMCARGYASMSFLYSAAECIKTKRVPTFIYHLGDYDPSGVNAGQKIEEDLRKMAPDAEIYFERLAVTRAQIDEWNLPTRPTKATDSRAKAFGDAESVELDAIPPDRLREIVEEAITRHISRRELAVLLAAEQSERETMLSIVDWFTNHGRGDCDD